MELLVGQVEELVGLDGGFVFSELLLQRIWLRGGFLRVGACTQDGRVVECVHPGRWNRRGGPDFLGARLRIGGVDTQGDVELHLRESDWAAHGHAADTAYGDVVLHVVLFPPREARLTAGVGGVALPILALLPLLPFDLEEHALDEAAEDLAGRPALEECSALLGLAPQDCREILDTHARARWSAKLVRAAARLSACGWEQACHAGALEALGHMLNREAMRQVAERHALAEWRAGCAQAGDIYMEFAGAWRRGGRPANHPLRRLEQYAAWVAGVPDWPDRLRALGPELARLGMGLNPGKRVGEGAGEFPGSGDAHSSLPPKGAWGIGAAACINWRPRRPRGFGALRRSLVKELCYGVLAGPRFDTFVCDHCFPLLASAFPNIEEDLHLCWDVWCPGDVAEGALVGLRRVFAGFDEMQVNCNGAQQGFIGWGLERRRLQDV